MSAASAAARCRRAAAYALQRATRRLAAREVVGEVIRAIESRAVELEEVGCQIELNAFREFSRFLKGEFRCYFDRDKRPGCNERDGHRVSELREALASGEGISCCSDHRGQSMKTEPVTLAEGVKWEYVPVEEPGCYLLQGRGVRPVVAVIARQDGGELVLEYPNLFFPWTPIPVPEDVRWARLHRDFGDERWPA